MFWQLHHTGQLQPHIRQKESYELGSSHFKEKLLSITFGPEEVLIIIDVVLLFTMVPVQEVIAYCYIVELFTVRLTASFRYVLATIEYSAVPMRQVHLCGDCRCGSGIPSEFIDGPLLYGKF